MFGAEVVVETVMVVWAMVDSKVMAVVGFVVDSKMSAVGTVTTLSFCYCWTPG